MSKRDSINGRLISFAITNGALEAKDLPSRLKLLSWGRNETVKGPVIVGPETLRTLSANQKSVGFEEIALDYNHQTVPSSPNYRPDPVQVAAYGSPEVVEGEGLFLNIREWTPNGREHAASYRDLSPTPQLDKNGEVIFLHSVALCRQGAVEGLTFYSASFTNPASLKPHTAPHPPKSMDYRASLLKLLALCGASLPDNPSDQEIEDAASKVKKPGDDVTPMSVELDKRLKALEAGREESERASLVALATSQGKVIPLTPDQIKTVPLTTLGALVENLKPTVPLESRGTGTPGANPAGDKKEGMVTLSVDQKAICQKLGITEEAYIKANPDLVPARASV